MIFREKLSLLLVKDVTVDNLVPEVTKMDIQGKVDSKLMLKMILLICKHLMENE